MPFSRRLPAWRGAANQQVFEREVDFVSLSIIQASGSPATRADALPGASATSLGVAIAAADQSIRSANHAFFDIAGAPAEQVIGAPLALPYEGGGDAACAEGIGRAFASRQQYSARLRAVRRNGEHFLAEIAVIPVSDAAGGLLHFVVVLRDVSTVSTVETALAATNRRLHELLDHLPAGVVVHDRDARVLSVNALAARLLGRSVDQMLGLAADRRAWRFLRADGSVMPPEEYPVNQTLRSGANLSSLVVGVDHGAPLGLVWVICNTYLVCDEGGALSGAVVCFTDYTELKHAEQSLQKSEERLRLVLQGANDAAGTGTCAPASCTTRRAGGRCSAANPANCRPIPTCGAA